MQSSRFVCVCVACLFASSCVLVRSWPGCEETAEACAEGVLSGSVARTQMDWHGWATTSTTETQVEEGVSLIQTRALHMTRASSKVGSSGANNRKDTTHSSSVPATSRDCDSEEEICWGLTPELPFIVSAAEQPEFAGICPAGCDGNYSAVLDFFRDRYERDEPDIELYFQVIGPYAIATGTIYNHTVDRLKALLQEHPEVQVIVTLWIPGSADDEVNLEAGRVLHKAGLQTCLPPGGVIESGGVDLFLAGRQRFATASANIGVHSWAEECNGLDIDGGDLLKEDCEHQLFLEYYSEICVPSSFYWFTLEKATSDDMHYLTEAELAEFTLTNCAAESGCDLPLVKRNCTVSCHEDVINLRGQAISSRHGGQSQTKRRPRRRQRRGTHTAFVRHRLL